MTTLSKVEEWVICDNKYDRELTNKVWTERIVVIW